MGQRRTFATDNQYFAKYESAWPEGRHPNEVGTIGALLMGSDGAFITGSDFLVDGGVTASYFYGELAN